MSRTTDHRGRGQQYEAHIYIYIYSCHVMSCHVMSCHVTECAHVCDEGRRVRKGRKEGHMTMSNRDWRVSNNIDVRRCLHQNGEKEMKKVKYILRK